jgi:hypothetical protein
MVHVLASSEVDRRFKPQSAQIKDFSNWHLLLFRYSSLLFGVWSVLLIFSVFCIELCGFVLFLCLVCPMLPVSLNCPFLISYIDDVLSLNNSRFGDFVDREIYPIELEIKDTTDTDGSALYLDIQKSL